MKEASELGGLVEPLDPEVRALFDDARRVDAMVPRYGQEACERVLSAGGRIPSPRYESVAAASSV